MKDIRPALRALLLSDPTVSGLVGGTRIYPVKLPQGMRDPSIVYARIGEFEEYALQGPADLANARMQVDAWSVSADTSAQLANAAMDVLDGFAGVVSYGSNSPQSFVEFQSIFLANAREEYEAETQLYRTSRDFQMWFMFR